MSILVWAVGAGAFAGGLGVGAALALGLARDKMAAITAAADEARSLIGSRSEGALKDLSAAHQRAEQLIGAIEAAKMSSARAEMSVSELMADIAQSKETLERATALGWFGAREKLPVLRGPIRLTPQGAEAAE
jgi:hypothetical protein